MSDSSEDQDLSRFREAVDTSFSKLINESRGRTEKTNQDEPKPKKSERYLEEASHYNDVKVPEEMQRRIGEKITKIIKKNIEFVDIESGIKKRKIKGGVKLFKDSTEYLSSEEAKDTYTELHNINAKKLQKVRKLEDGIEEDEKVKAAAITGDYVLSRVETKSWKSRRKEKLFKYKSKGKSKVLTAVE